jgi:hypothetical protein
MAKNFRELVAWQLAFELSERIQKLLQSGPASRDFKFAISWQTLRDPLHETSPKGSEGSVASTNVLNHCPEPSQ